MRCSRSGVEEEWLLSGFFNELMICRAHAVDARSSAAFHAVVHIYGCVTDSIDRSSLFGGLCCTTDHISFFVQT